MKLAIKNILFVVIGLFVFSLINPFQVFKHLIKTVDTEYSSLPEEETEDCFKFSEEKELCNFKFFQHPVFCGSIVWFSFLLQGIPVHYFKIISPPPDFFV